MSALSDMERVSDVELVRGAQAGEVGCLSVLLARHQAPMRAAAVGVLGHHPDVDDAVQEASLTALRRIGDLRDPQAVGAWLRAIARNQGRMLRRARVELPVEDLEPLLRPGAALDPRLDPVLDPAARLDQHPHGDWIRQAVDELSPALHLVTLLRYFSSVTSYQQIAQLCEVPVGTVRSRLSLARGQLAQKLLTVSDLAEEDLAARTRARRQEAEQIYAAGQAGSLRQALAGTWSPDLETRWPQGRLTHGFDYLAAAMDRDLSAGVRHRLADVVVGRGVVIWEADLISPPEDPFHCPPSVLWVQTLEAGRVRRLRLFHPDRNHPDRQRPDRPKSDPAHAARAGRH
jgi:RNA polymerase sigma-70 factor (ECF subfamily)